MDSKFYLTTPIYYVNDVPHVGHAYTTIIADIVARWQALSGKKVFFLTGTDEHGIKIQRRAHETKKEAQAFCDANVQEFKNAWKALHIKYSNFIRTTDEAHVRAVQHAVQKLYESGTIYQGVYRALYCSGCEQYKTSSELVEGNCSLHQKPAEIREEEAYLFRLSAFRERLLAAIKSGTLEILPKERQNEMVSFLEQEELQDVSISRKKEEVSWGIELPFDKDYTLYVWIDAFLNYLTGISWPDPSFAEFWPPNLHLLGKDILRVHATIWPALLMSLGLTLPQRLFVHGYFTVNGQKMSKSLGNVIDPIYLSRKYGSDAVRYFITREISLGHDGDFSESSLQERYNNELANKLGNLVSRVISLIEKKQEGKIVPGTVDSALSARLDSAQIQKNMEVIAPDKALAAIFSFVDAANEYVQEKKPWQLEGEQARDVLYTLADSLRVLSVVLSPFLPECAEKIAAQLNCSTANQSLQDIEFGKLKAGTVQSSPVLFPKMN